VEGPLLVGAGPLVPLYAAVCTDVCDGDVLRGVWLAGGGAMSVRGCGHCCSGLHTSRPLALTTSQLGQCIACQEMRASLVSRPRAGRQAGLRGKFKPHSAAASLDERVF